MSGSRYDEAEKNRAGYGNYTTPRYQSFGPKEDKSLDRVLLSIGDAGVDEERYSPFEIIVPDVKCRVRVDFAIEAGGSGDIMMAENTLVLGAAGLRLWAALRARPQSESAGSGQAFGTSPPVQNLVGTGGAPLAIPTDTRLWGYGFEVETAAEDIAGWVRTVPGAEAGPFRLHLIVRYNSLERMSPEEWKQLVGRCGIRRGDRVSVGGGE